jgi:hypothetical protein
MRYTFLSSWIDTRPIKFFVYVYQFAALKPLHRAIMKVIETEIIDTTEQIKDLVDWLVFRHAPPVSHAPTMYADLEGLAFHPHPFGRYGHTDEARLPNRWLYPEAGGVDANVILYLQEWGHF